jgi:diguanylate cyclase
MQADKETLQIISNETKGSINHISVVTPSMYASIFKNFALSHKTQIENEKDLANDLIMGECSRLTDLQIQTSKNVQQLSKNTDMAIGAIKDKNESLLNDILHETENLRKELEKLKKSVYRDELTNTFNRKWLHDNVLNEDLQSFNTSGTLAMIDLNYFKIINDTYGHIIGDKVLVFIANQLKKTKESVIRYGGDEFIVIFSNSSIHKNAFSELDRLREEILHKQVKVKDDLFRMSFSIGIQEFKRDDILAEIIEQADKDMYDDKMKIKKRITGI